MSEERDFDYVVGKLPRKDKDGNDTTGAVSYTHLTLPTTPSV